MRGGRSRGVKKGKTKKGSLEDSARSLHVFTPTPLSRAHFYNSTRQTVIFKPNIFN